MNVLLGFAFGFLLGAKSGPNSIEEIRHAWETISQSDEFQTLLATGQGLLQQAISQGGGSLGELLANFNKLGGGKAVEQIVALGSGKGDGNAVWASVAQTPEFQMLLARGLSLVDGMLAGGLTGAARGAERGM